MRERKGKHHHKKKNLIRERVEEYTYQKAKAPNQRLKLPPFNSAARTKIKNREIRKPERERACVRERKGKQKMKEETIAEKKKEKRKIT
jgi:hypothetical protein